VSGAPGAGDLPMLPIADEKYRIWLVWSLMKNGTVALRAVASTPEIAARYRKMCLLEPVEPVSVRVEQREINHGYGHFDTMYLSPVGRPR